MCGRFTLASYDLELLQERFGFHNDPGLAPRYNIAPSQQLPAIIQEGSERRMGTLQWGLVPHWTDDPDDSIRPINARAETVADKPFFRDAFQRRRCLIVADGFYEWKEEEQGGKQPYRVVIGEGEPFAFAGLWERWRSDKGTQGDEAAGDEPLDTCTIITTDANAALSSIYPRMPVILSPEAEATWLDPDVGSAQALTPLLRPYPAEAVSAYRVSTAVNSPANDIPECIQPLEAD